MITAMLTKNVRSLTSSQVNGSDFFNEGYWMELRKLTRVKGIGKNECDDWVYDVLRHWQKENVQHIFQRASAKRFLGGFYFGKHSWLEAIVSERRFIADGTAGQYDDSYPLGFYGWLDDAPPKVKEFYLLKR